MRSLPVLTLLMPRVHVLQYLFWNVSCTKCFSPPPPPWNAIRITLELPKGGNSILNTGQAAGRMLMCKKNNISRGTRCSWEWLCTSSVKWDLVHFESVIYFKIIFGKSSWHYYAAPLQLCREGCYKYPFLSIIKQLRYKISREKGIKSSQASASPSLVLTQH